MSAVDAGVRASLVTGATNGTWSISCSEPMPQRICGARPPSTTIGERFCSALAIALIPLVTQRPRDGVDVGLVAGVLGAVGEDDLAARGDDERPAELVSVLLGRSQRLVAQAAERHAERARREDLARARPAQVHRLVGRLVGRQ